MIKTAGGGYFWKWIFSKMPELSSAILEIPAEILSNLKAQENAKYKKLMMAEFSRSALRNCAYIKTQDTRKYPGFLLRIKDIKNSIEILSPDRLQ